MKQIKQKAAEIAQAAVAKKLKNPGLSDRAAQLEAVLDAGYRGSWLDDHDDLVEVGYRKAMRTIRIESWPAFKYWGWFFSWPWGVVSWTLIFLLMLFTLSPRPQISLSTLQSDISAIRASLTRVEVAAAQIEAIDQRSQEGMAAIEELRTFTQRLEKTKLFRKNAGSDWRNTIFGGK